MLTPDHPLYDWFGLNTRLFLLVNSVRVSAIDSSMLVVSALGHPRMYPFYMAVTLWLAWRRPALLPQRNAVVFALGYVLVSMLTVPILKQSLDFPRPVSVLGEQVRVLGDSDPMHAFPSGHAAFAVLTACALIPGAALPIRVLLAVFAILVCVSRVAVGAHFPADVIGGAAIACLTGAVLRNLLRGQPKADGDRN